MASDSPSPTSLSRLRRFIGLYQFHLPNADFTAGTRYVRTTSASMSMLKQNAKPISFSIMLLEIISVPSEPARMMAAAVMIPLRMVHLTR